MQLIPWFDQSNSLKLQLDPQTLISFIWCLNWLQKSFFFLQLTLFKILIKSLPIQIFIYLPQIKILLPIGSFINQNWVANFICFGPLSFSLVTLALHHKLGQYSRISSCISSCFLNFFFYFFLFSFLDIFIGSKINNNKSSHLKKSSL
jgi:hypothetical protein